MNGNPSEFTEENEARTSVRPRDEDFQGNAQPETPHEKSKGDRKEKLWVILSIFGFGLFFSVVAVLLFYAFSGHQKTKVEAVPEVIEEESQTSGTEETTGSVTTEETTIEITSAEKTSAEDAAAEEASAAAEEAEQAAQDAAAAAEEAAANTETAPAE